MCVALGLTTIPDHSTLNRVVPRLTILRLTRLLTRLLDQLTIKESGIAGDSTGT